MRPMAAPPPLLSLDEPVVLSDSPPTEFRFRKKQVWGTLAWAAGGTFFALLLFLWSAFQWSDRPGPNAGNYANRAFLAGWTFLIISGVLWVQVVAQALQKIRVYPGGFIIQSPLFRRGVRWAAIDEMACSEPTQAIAILTRQSPPEFLRIPGQAVECGDELGRLLRERALAVLVPELMARLRQGETIPLGRAQLHPGGMTYFCGQFAASKSPSLYRGPLPTGAGRQRLAQQAGDQMYQFPWHDIIDVQTSPEGNVLVRTPTAMVDLNCAAEDVPNLFAVPEVARVMRGQPSARLTPTDLGAHEPLLDQPRKDITNLVRGIAAGVCVLLGLGALVVIMGLGRRPGGPDNTNKGNEPPPAEAKLEPPAKFREFPVEGLLRRAAFHNQGNKVLACMSGPQGSRIKRWDTYNGKEEEPLFTSADAIHDFVLSASGMRLVLAFGEKGIQVYDNNVKGWDFPLEGQLARRVALSPDMNWVAASVTDAAGKSEWIKVWDLGKNSLAWSHGPMPLPTDSVDAGNPTMRVAFTKENKLLLGTGKPGEILIHTLPTGAKQQTSIDKLQAIRLITTSPFDTLNLAAITPKSPVALGKVAELTALKILPPGPDAACLCAAFSENGKVLATGYAGGQVYFWDVAKERELIHMDIGGPCRFIDVSPAANYLLTAGPTIQLWTVDEILRRP